MSLDLTDDKLILGARQQNITWTSADQISMPSFAIPGPRWVNSQYVMISCGLSFDSRFEWHQINENEYEMIMARET